MKSIIISLFTMCAISSCGDNNTETDVNTTTDSMTTIYPETSPGDSGRINQANDTMPGMSNRDTMNNTGRLRDSSSIRDTSRMQNP